MKTQIKTALRKLNDWTLIAMNDPQAMEHSHKQQTWPAIG